MQFAVNKPGLRSLAAIAHWKPKCAMYSSTNLVNLWVTISAREADLSAARIRPRASSRKSRHEDDFPISRSFGPTNDTRVARSDFLIGTPLLRDRPPARPARPPLRLSRPIVARSKSGRSTLSTAIRIGAVRALCHELDNQLTWKRATRHVAPS